MDNRIEAALKFLRHHRNQYTAEPLCAVPQVREYVTELDATMDNLQVAGRELAQKIIKYETKGSTINNNNDGTEQ